MDKFVINFGNVVEEMKSKEIKLCLFHNNHWGIIDKNNRLYTIEQYYNSTCLDKFIENQIRAEFILVGNLESINIESWRMEIWDTDEVEAFIERQSKYWI